MRRMSGAWPEEEPSRESLASGARSRSSPIGGPTQLWLFVTTCWKKTCEIFCVLQLTPPFFSREHRAKQGC